MRCLGGYWTRWVRSDASQPAARLLLILSGAFQQQAPGSLSHGPKAPFRVSFLLCVLYPRCLKKGFQDEAEKKKEQKDRSNGFFLGRMLLCPPISSREASRKVSRRRRRRRNQRAQEQLLSSWADGSMFPLSHSCEETSGSDRHVTGQIRSQLCRHQTARACKRPHAQHQSRTAFHRLWLCTSAGSRAHSSALCLQDHKCVSGPTRRITQDKYTRSLAASNYH